MQKTKRNRILIIIVVVVLAAVAAYWIFSKKENEIIPGTTTDPKPSPAEEIDGQTVQAVLETVTEWTNAVGTVQPRVQARIESRIAGQITDIRVNAGDKIVSGQLLMVIDDRQMKTKLSQAEQSLESTLARKKQADQAVNAATAAFNAAHSAHQRTEKFYKAQAATEQDLEEVRSSYLQAKAGVKRAQDALAEARSGVKLAKERIREANIALDYTHIKAPADGAVLKRLADPGDFAMPGKPLLLLRTKDSLRFEAHVRESLIDKTPVGKTLSVKLQVIGKTVDVTVEELVPYADPRTRTFLVKTDLPRLSGLYPGMYGKLLIPQREVDLVLIPVSTVHDIGQLEVVMVKSNNRWQRRYIRTGSRYGDRIEVLSGITAGEILKIKEPAQHGG